MRDATFVEDAFRLKRVGQNERVGRDRVERDFGAVAVGVRQESAREIERELFSGTEDTDGEDLG